MDRRQAGVASKDQIQHFLGLALCLLRRLTTNEMSGLVPQAKYMTLPMNDIATILSTFRSSIRQIEKSLITLQKYANGWKTSSTRFS